MISIVTVSMNRTEHLLHQARKVSMLRGHEEHIIIDLGSTKRICRDQLPSDKRIHLHRVESPNGRWWLTHSYNLAFALATSDYILKLDADILPTQKFIDFLFKKKNETSAHLMCNRLTLQDWSLPTELFTSNGLFLCKRSSLDAINGFNPYIQGWGWDEIDLYSRFFLAGFPVCRIPDLGLDLIQHVNELREHSSSIATLPLSVRLLVMSNHINSAKKMQAQHYKNKIIAVASIIKQLKWPSLDDYARSYLEFSRLPALLNASLFDVQEKESLTSCLLHQLLSPSRIENLLWRMAKRIGFGPFATSSTQALLDACHIDLSLVA
jgi:hypothetical protein